MLNAQDMILKSDASVFKLESLTGQRDRETILRAQNIVARKGAYKYAEVGCHLGGTLVSSLLDRRCKYVAAIDKRPNLSPDERSVTFAGTVSAEEMIVRLKTVVSEDNLEKLNTFDLDASEIKNGQISDIDLCFIDGEHTNRAAFSDFLYMLRCCASDCIVLFHDANLVSDGLRNVETYLRLSGRQYKTLCAQEVMFVVMIGSYASLPDDTFPDAHDKEQFFIAAKEQLWADIARTSIAIGRTSAA